MSSALPMAILNGIFFLQQRNYKCTKKIRWEKAIFAKALLTLCKLKLCQWRRANWTHIMSDITHLNWKKNVVGSVPTTLSVPQLSGTVPENVKHPQSSFIWIKLRRRWFLLREQVTSVFILQQIGTTSLQFQTCKFSWLAAPRTDALAVTLLRRLIAI